jgi:hypothetical protein
MKSFALAIGMTVVGLGAASAQEYQHFAFNVGAGFTTPAGNTGRYVDEGWNVGAGAGFNFSPYVGALIDLSYNTMGINSTTLASFGAPGVGMHVFSATVDPIVHLMPKSHVDVYVTGGGGLYRRQEDLTAPTVAVVPAGNPFFGYYPLAVPATAVLASSSIVKPGVDIGMGFAFGSKWHGKFFAEAKYNRIIMGQYHTDYVPVTFGFRW